MKEFSECYHTELIEFLNEYCKDCTNFIELKEKIPDVEVKSKKKSKIPKFTMKLYAFFIRKSCVFQ